MFRKALDQSMLELLIKYAAGVTILLAILVLPFGYYLYGGYCLLLAAICAIAYTLNRKGHFQFAFLFLCITTILFMVVLTFVFGFINAHLYLLVGMVVLSYVAMGKKYLFQLVWLATGALFLLANIILKESGRVGPLTEVEELLFYPNLIFAIVLLFLSTTLYRTKLEQQRIDLNSSLQYKNKLLAILSHDLREPFRNLSNIVQLLETGNLSKEELSENIKKVKTNLSTSNAMLDNVLLWVTTQRKELKPHLENISLDEIIQNNIRLHQEQAEAKGIVLRAQSTNVELHSDCSMLNSILRNIFSNAVTYAPIHKGEVRVNVKEEEQMICVEVTDNGPGISNEIINQLVGNAKNTASANSGPGFGIGLQLVKVLCDLLNIEVQVNSREGKGSTFSLIIPKESTPLVDQNNSVVAR